MKSELMATRNNLALYLKIGTSSHQRPSKTQPKVNHLIGLMNPPLMTPLTKNQPVGMMSPNKFLILKPRNPKIGMMRLTAPGKLL
jgi:hypothetical protein